MSLDIAYTDMYRNGKVLFASLVWIMFGQLAIGAEWKVAGALDQGVEYDDNIALRLDASPAFGYLLRPKLNADWSTANMGLGLTGSGDIRRYDDEQWNCDNFSLGANQHYLMKTQNFSVAGGYSQSCSYSQQTSDTGILVPGNQSENYNLSPNWSWQWAPLDKLNLSPSYSRNSFSAIGTGNGLGSGANFRSNDTYSLNLTETHEWNRRLSSNHSLFFSRSEFSNVGSANSQNMYGFQLGGQYAISRAWSINAGAGGRWVQQPSSINNPLASNSSDSPIFTNVANLGVNYKGHDMDYGFNFSRTVNPSAYGQLLEMNSVKMNYSYQISRELDFNIDASLQKNQSIGQSQVQSAQNRTYYTASSGLVWKFSKDWKLSASYRYRRQEYPDVQGGQTINALAGAQESNAFMLHLNYNWDGLRVSR